MRGKNWGEPRKVKCNQLHLYFGPNAREKNLLASFNTGGLRLLNGTKNKGIKPDEGNPRNNPDGWQYFEFPSAKNTSINLLEEPIKCGLRNGCSSDCTFKAVWLYNSGEPDYVTIYTQGSHSDSYSPENISSSRLSPLQRHKIRSLEMQHQSPSKIQFALQRSAGITPGNAEELSHSLPTVIQVLNFFNNAY